MDETIEEHGRSLAAPIIFTIVVAFQFISRFIEQKKKGEKLQQHKWQEVMNNLLEKLKSTQSLLEKPQLKGSKSGVEAQLRTEIKQLCKEASSMSQPSTFAQAAKLKRMALAKEKDLAKIQELHKKEMKLSYDAYLKGLTILKIFTYFSLICWFWRIPVAAISKQLVEPFGRDYTMVDIIYQSQQNYLSKVLQLEGFATLKKIKNSGEIVVIHSLYLSKFIDFVLLGVLYVQS
ncbi:hypothetical protein TEA_015496 [Camellia sinensis var. sinensis]|uniref:Uncharacterized protein n=1 Tax=Camellia sinensis var. sinensis TaxID=542762 RepID=A0A4S4DMM5_CAMSN|nr:hypothetical protein TEA_015496 [Camellia sinensis var. sinensis]